MNHVLTLLHSVISSGDDIGQHIRRVLSNPAIILFISINHARRRVGWWVRPHRVVHIVRHGGLGLHWRSRECIVIHVSIGLGFLDRERVLSHHSLARTGKLEIGWALRLLLLLLETLILQGHLSRLCFRLLEVVVNIQILRVGVRQDVGLWHPDVRRGRTKAIRLHCTAVIASNAAEVVQCILTPVAYGLGMIDWHVIFDLRYLAARGSQAGVTQVTEMVKGRVRRGLTGDNAVRGAVVVVAAVVRERILRPVDFRTRLAEASGMHWRLPIIRHVVRHEIVVGEWIWKPGFRLIRLLDQRTGTTKRRVGVGGRVERRDNHLALLIRRGRYGLELWRTMLRFDKTNRLGATCDRLMMLRCLMAHKGRFGQRQAV